MAIDLNDKTSNGNNLTNSGAAEVTTSLPFAQSTIAADLEASESDYLYAADSASLSITGNITIELWVKFESTPSSGNTMDMVSKYDDQSGNQRSWRFFLYNDGGTLKLQFNYSDDGTAQDALAVAWTPSAGTWYHAAVTLTASSSEAKFYVDGVQQGTTQTGTKTAIFNSTARAALGALNVDGTPSSFNDAVIDDVRVWNVVRTGTQINDNKSVELAGSESGLVAYWSFESLGSPSASLSPSASASPSLSPSASISPSSSASPSISPSASISASVSPSASLSPSASVSPSPSISPSASASASISPSASLSPSASASSSISPSTSLSPSASSSSSRSPSSSVSASPSLGYSLYSRGDEASLPTANSDLETTYTDAEETKVATRNDIRIGQTGTLQYMMHQFKGFVGSETRATIEWEGQSSLAPKYSAVYLQIYNHNTSAWETKTSNSTADDGIDFELSATITDLTNYKDSSNVISCRVYQLAI